MNSITDSKEAGAFLKSNSSSREIHNTQVADLSIRVQTAAQDLFGQTDKAHNLILLAKRLESETAEVMDHRVAGTVIAFVGGKNAGKTTLASLMVDDADLAQELQRNAGLEKDTIRLGWIGTTPPKELNPEREVFMRGASVLGSDCWLLDCPSFAGSTSAEKDIASYALLLADINVLVVTEAEMRADINATELKSGNGSLVIPVVRKEKLGVDGDWEAETQETKFRESTNNFLQHLRVALPDSHILDPIIVPDFKCSGRTHQEAEETCRSRVREALYRARGVELITSRREKMSRAKIRKFHLELRRLFSFEFERLGGSLKELENQENELPAKVAERFLGPDYQLRTVLRSRLLWRAASEVWLVWFPFRSITWLLALTSGAWDRLFLALAGSTPSLVLTYCAAAKNLRDIAALQSLQNDTLRSHFERDLAERLQPALQQFQDGARELLGGEDRSSLQRSTVSTMDIRITGFDAVKDASAHIFTDCLEAHRVPTWWMQTWGLFAASIFGWLAWHPMCSLYHRFLEATAWQDFPAPATSMIITSVLLSVLPVFLLAIICLAFGIAIARVNKCVAAVRQRHHDEITKLAANGTLRLELKTPQVEAARTLLSLAAD